jgi:peroxiredoxin
MLRTCLALCLLPAVSVAGEFNKTLSVGDPAPVWKDLPGTDGKKHSLADYKDKDVVVLVFTCNSCACSEEYEDRIIAFARKYQDKVALVAVNVNTIPDDRLDAMKKKADKKKFPFPYLYDETQRIARDFGATYTPEFFVLNKDRKVAYMGAMDDKTKADEVKDKYLETAVDAVLKGEKPPKAETVAHGCLIRYKRVRD